jgi:transcription elongation factor Elf1
MEAIFFCVNCNKDTVHLFSGSGTKGECMTCGMNLKPEIRADMRYVISYNG